MPYQPPTPGETLIDRPPVFQALVFLVVGWVGALSNAVGAVEPSTEIDKLAALTAEGAEGRVLLTGHAEDLVAGWTFKRGHDETLVRER